MELNKAFVETEINDWNDLFLFNQRFMSQFIFRGQANSEWGLKTSLERLIENHYPFPNRDRRLPAIYENDMIRVFKWKYPIYEKVYIPQDDEYIEWLSIMQHFGAPTRLLDFTDSMYIALYMSLAGSFYDESSIWCINKVVLNHPVFNRYRIEHHVDSASQNELDEFSYQLANCSIKQGLKVSPQASDGLLYSVRPHMTNQRISCQQGLFIVPSLISIPFEDLLKNYYIKENRMKIKIDSLQRISNENMNQNAIFILKINIPKNNNLNLTKALKQMNITAETMFPGLEGLANSLANLRMALGIYKD